MPQIQDCKRELREILASSQETSEPHIVLSAGELHKRVFGEANHETAVCCAAMRSELREGDTIVRGSDDDLSSVFTVRYVLPRPVPIVQADAQD